MSKLPNPQDFNSHNLNYAAATPAQKPSSKGYNLENLHTTFKNSIKTIDEKILVKQGNELIDYKFYMSTPHPAAAKHLFGYSNRDDSFTIHLKDRSDVTQAVAVRESVDHKGDRVKWKTFGSKKFTPYNIEDDFIFFYSGMAEIAIMKMMGLSYIGIQSDSMVKHLPLELKALTAGKTIVVLQDNDESFRKIVPQIQGFFRGAKVLVLDFEMMLNRELKHGYDFRDFCNQTKDAKEVMNRLEIEIICLQDKSHVR